MSNRSTKKVKSNKKKLSKSKSDVPSFHRVDKVSKLRLKHAWNRNYNWTKEEISWVVYWVRQVISFLFGLLWGIIPIQGLMGVLLYLTSSFMALEAYTRFLNVNENVFDKLDVLKEGFAPAIGTFLVKFL